jgi:glycosyltransferase involved in cell wall biosynthesis
MRARSLKCTVIIPTYNRSSLLGQTLFSLSRQTLPREEFEVIVVDDGSSDDSRSIAESYADRLSLSYFYQPDEGFRVAAARNVGIRHARADICVFVDTGMLLPSHFVTEHLAAHAGADVPLAVCGYTYGHKNSEEGTWELLSQVDALDPDGAVRKLAGLPQWQDIREVFYAKYTDDFHDLPAPWVIYWTNNVSARTAQIRAVGMFDENFRSWGVEDMDLAYRLHRDGARFVLNRNAAAIHLPHSKDASAIRTSEDGNYAYMARKYGTPIVNLLPLFPEIGPFTINDVIRERGLPSCAEYLAERRRAGAEVREPAEVRR